MSDVTAKLLQVDQWDIAVGASKTAGGVKLQVFTVAAPQKPFDKKSFVSYSCVKKMQLKRASYKRKADEATGKSKPGGCRRDGGRGGGSQEGAALAFTASAGQPGSINDHGSTSGSWTWVLDYGETDHVAAGAKSFADQAAGSGSKVTLDNGDNLFIKGNGHISMDVVKGSAHAHMVASEAVLVPDLTSNLLSVRARPYYGYFPMRYFSEYEYGATLSR